MRGKTYAGTRKLANAHRLVVPPIFPHPGHSPLASPISVSWVGSGTMAPAGCIKVPPHKQGVCDVCHACRKCPCPKPLFGKPCTASHVSLQRGRKRTRLLSSTHGGGTCSSAAASGAGSYLPPLEPRRSGRSSATSVGTYRETSDAADDALMRIDEDNSTCEKLVDRLETEIRRVLQKLVPRLQNRHAAFTSCQIDTMPRNASDVKT